MQPKGICRQFTLTQVFLAKKFCFAGLLLSLKMNIFVFHRDIYYNDTQLFGSQRNVDIIVDDISCMLKVPRRSLHVVSVYVHVTVCVFAW